MLNKNNEIKQIHKALRLIKTELKKTNELLQLLWELMHEDHVLIIY